ncbi:MAG: hypothetical protein SFX73_06105, partial [Kofleriaceae bacterium]|nr:hypothetical protein [Kofleriaceae bacterium]
MPRVDIVAAHAGSSAAPAVAPPPVDASLVAPPAAPPDASNVRAAATPPALPSANPEVQLVETARIALRRGAGDDAVRTLMAHERRFPR